MFFSNITLFLQRYNEFENSIPPKYYFSFQQFNNYYQNRIYLNVSNIFNCNIPFDYEKLANCEVDYEIYNVRVISAVAYN